MTAYHFSSLTKDIGSATEVCKIPSSPSFFFNFANQIFEPPEIQHVSIWELEWDFQNGSH